MVWSDLLRSCIQVGGGYGYLEWTKSGVKAATAWYDTMLK